MTIKRRKWNGAVEKPTRPGLLRPRRRRPRADDGQPLSARVDQHQHQQGQRARPAVVGLRRTAGVLAVLHGLGMFACRQHMEPTIMALPISVLSAKKGQSVGVVHSGRSSLFSLVSAVSRNPRPTLNATNGQRRPPETPKGHSRSRKSISMSSVPGPTTGQRTRARSLTILPVDDVQIDF